MAPLKKKKKKEKGKKEITQAGSELHTIAEGRYEPRTVQGQGQARACGLPYPTLFGFLKVYGRITHFIV